MNAEKLNKMDSCRYLLPEPGGEVVGELIAELRKANAMIEAAHDELKKWCEDFCKNTPCSDCNTRKLIAEMEALWRKD